MSESRAGEPPTTPEPSPAPSADAAAASTVTRDVPCIDCNYNLRGLSFDSYCPECGSSSKKSLAPDRLIFADVAWLNRLRRGAAMIAFAHLGWFVAMLMQGLGAAKVVDYDSSAGKVLAMFGFFEWFAVFVGMLGLVYCSKPEPVHVTGTRRPRRTMMIAAGSVSLAFYTLIKLSDRLADADTSEWLLAIALLAMTAGNIAYAKTCAGYLRRARVKLARWIALAIAVGSTGLLGGFSLIIFIYRHLDSTLHLVTGFAVLFLLAPAYLLAGICHVYAARAFYQTLQTAESLDQFHEAIAEDEPA